jgi:crotonobetaine/carnitine-CoA ligase
MSETITHGIVGHVGLPNRALSMGRPSPLYQVAIRDDDGQPVQPGATGALFIKGVRGLSLFAEYLHDEAATAASFDEDGWFDTGDRVTLFEDGFIRFSDRANDMIKVGGENVAASEVEAVILSVGRVSEVAVVGRPHRYLHEVLVAYVLPRDPRNAQGLQAEVLARCAERLSDFKVPVAVEIVDELPRSLLGKLAKVQLRRAAARQGG